MQAMGHRTVPHDVAVSYCFKSVNMILIMSGMDAMRPEGRSNNQNKYL